MTHNHKDNKERSSYVWLKKDHYSCELKSLKQTVCKKMECHFFKVWHTRNKYQIYYEKNNYSTFVSLPTFGLIKQKEN